MELNVKDKVIVDINTEDAVSGIVLMLGDKFAGIYTEFGDRIVVPTDRLTKS